MKRTVLVLGGSYFIGRVFSIMAERSGDFEITLLNRGRFPLKKPGVAEFIFDRRNPRMPAEFDKKEFDVLIDFCAYDPGDSEKILSMFSSRIKQYVEISTCGVFAASENSRTEETPLVSSIPSNPVEEYSWKKMILEKEIKDQCSLLALPFTIFRPCFVYGPFNYAPRESYYFDLILSGAEIPFPVDSRSQFSFVYVKDIARALMSSIGKEKAFNQDYNLAAPERISYGKFMEQLAALVPERELPRKSVYISDVYTGGIPLPFPLDQNELFQGTKAQIDLGLEYTGFDAGMKESFEVYRSVKNAG
jgi:nucleoside-diphosphate-sugar epimerase